MLLGCQCASMKPNCFGCTKEQMNSLSLACEEPGAWLSLSCRRYLKILSFSSASLWFSLCLPPPLPLSLSLPFSSRHYWASRMSYHTCPHSHNDCSHSYIHHATGHLPRHIDMVPACWKCTAGKEAISSLVGKLQVQHFLKYIWQKGISSSKGIAA